MCQTTFGHTEQICSFKWNTGCQAHFQLHLQVLATVYSHFEIITYKLRILFCFVGSVAVGGVGVVSVIVVGVLASTVM